MANKNMKRCSTSIIVREMQIKTTMRHHFIPVRIGIIKKSINDKCWRSCREKGTFLHSLWKCKLIQPLWRAVWKFLKKLGIKLQYDPAIPLLGTHPEKTIIQRHMYSSFHSSSICNTRTWKQPKYPLTDEWIKKLWYIYTVEYNSAIKRNGLKSIIVK